MDSLSNLFNGDVLLFLLEIKYYDELCTIMAKELNAVIVSIE